jgi:hypothetical protein
LDGLLTRVGEGAGAAQDGGAETPGELARDDGDEDVFSKSESRQDSEQ